MVQVNLLPDVKKEYLRSQQSKQAIVLGAILISVVFIVIATLLFAYVQIVQPRHLANMQNDIDSGLAQINEVPDGEKIVTVQGALEKLPGLQDSKQISSRLFKYITGFTPKGISYSEITVDLVANTITLRGVTTDYEKTNVLANNLKSAELSYKENDASATTKPFSQVVFKNLGRAEDVQNVNAVSFQIDLQFDPTLFRESVSDPVLKVNADSDELLIPSAKPFSGSGAGQ